MNNNPGWILSVYVFTGTILKGTVSRGGRNNNLGEILIAK
jgi:hypothetical protein